MFWEENFFLHLIFKIGFVCQTEGWVEGAERTESCRVHSNHDAACLGEQPLSEQPAPWGPWPWVTTSPKSQLGPAIQTETETGNGRRRRGGGQGKREG